MNSTTGQDPAQVPHCIHDLVGLPCEAYIKLEISWLNVGFDTIDIVLFCFLLGSLIE